MNMNKPQKVTVMLLVLVMVMSLLPVVGMADQAHHAPIIDYITITPPDQHPGDNLTITFTYVYDRIGRADLAGQSAIWFYITPESTVSFNRALEIYMDNGDHVTLPAGQQMIAGEYNFGFHYGVFEVTDHPHVTERSHAINFVVVGADNIPELRTEPEFRVMTFLAAAPAQPSQPAAVENPAENPVLEPGAITTTLTTPQAVTSPATTPSAITPPAPEVPTTTPQAVRVLRFPVGSTNYTDNGQLRPLDAAPFIAQDRTMVPLRVISEALGAVDLDFTAGVVSFVIDGQSFSMTVNQPLPNNMGTPVIVADRTFVPLGFIINELGATARWDSPSRVAYVYI